MKILTLHVDYINFKPLKKALKSIADLSDQEKKGQEVSEALVVLTSIEKGDLIKETVEELVKNVKDIAQQVKTKNVVLYPYAHLSNNLASPDLATEILSKTEKELSKEFKVSKAPFGYYKEFELKVKGHPLSELSRTFGPEKEMYKEQMGRPKVKSEDYSHEVLLKEISKSKLDTSKLKDNDHRILGRQMDLFSFSEVAPGMVFWHNNGLIIRNGLIEFWRDLQRKAEYQEVSTPQIMDSKLWKISGHWDKYKDNIFLSSYEGRDFAVKPMNCPGGMIVYRSSPKSYKDLPLRVAELGIVHRQELSGVLGGLFRVIQFTQDDAHIFCTEEQLEEEIKSVIELDEAIYSKFGFEYTLELSTRPEKRIGTEKQWDLAEQILEKVLKKSKMKYKINKGDGAFYGPKIDFHLKDSLGRTWQCGTIQLDFSFPDRFELEYVDSDNQKKRPVMLHRTLYGSLERFIGILLEHTNGRLPTWIAPTQVRVISFTERNDTACKKAIKKLGEEIPNLRLDADFRNVPIQSKVRDAELLKIPYIIVIGDKEEKDGSLAVRAKGEGKVKNMKIVDFVKNLKKEIESRA